MPENEITFQRWPEGLATLTPLIDAGANSSDVARIAGICSQPKVYDVLFARRLNGEPYTAKNAQEFIDSSTSNWQAKAQFVYAIRGADGEIVGMIDIKSPPPAAEIGYWVDEQSPGYVTNAVEALIEAAKAAGYQELYALVLKDNQRSKNVVERTEFIPLPGETKRDGQEGFIQYVKIL